jgi:hypothetical protein
MGICDALEDVEIGFRQLEFTIKLLLQLRTDHACFDKRAVAHKGDQ